MSLNKKPIKVSVTSQATIESEDSSNDMMIFSQMNLSLMRTLGFLQVLLLNVEGALGQFL